MLCYPQYQIRLLEVAVNVDVAMIFLRILLIVVFVLVVISGTVLFFVVRRCPTTSAKLVRCTKIAIWSLIILAVNWALIGILLFKTTVDTIDVVLVYTFLGALSVFLSSLSGITLFLINKAVRRLRSASSLA